MNQGSKIQYRIYRHPEGIGLNGKEFAVDDKKDIILFKIFKNIFYIFIRISS